MWTAKFFGIRVITLLSGLGLVVCSEQVVTSDLVSDIFRNYSASLIPICRTGNNVTMSVGIALRQIINLNEQEQLLTSYVWVRLSWTDCRLTWNTTDYNSISMIHVPYDMVWVPDIALYDSAAEEEMMAGIADYNAHVYSTGVVNYFFPAVVKTVCRINVRYFPFDTQHCSLKFGSWSFSGNSLDIYPGTSDMSNYFKNSEWIIDDMPVERNVLYYTCCDNPYPDVTFHLHLKRRPHFYLLPLIFPCILMSLAASLGFILPVESGEKVSLEITVLLSLAVFMLVVTDTMPPSSNNFPILGTYFATSMAMVGVSCFHSVIVLNVFYRGAGGRQVPRWAKVYVVGYLGRLLRLKGSSNKIEKYGDVNQRRDQNGIRPEDVSKDETFNRRNDRNNHIIDKCDQESITHVENMDARDVQPRRKPRVLPGISPGDLSVKTTNTNCKILKRVSDFIDDKSREDETNSDWRDVAKTLDRLFLLIYSVVSLFVFFGFVVAILTQ